MLLIYQNHSEETVLFENALLEIRKEHPHRFAWISLFSRPGNHKHKPERLNNYLLEKLLLENGYFQQDALFYLCGPAAFMRMAQFTLKVLGIGDGQIKKENFTIDYIPPPPVFMDSTSRTIIIHYRKHTFQIEAAYPITILQAALNNNITLPYSCRGGRCSSCVARCLSGKVIMSINEVLTEKDLAYGLILTCVGFAETNVELDFDNNCKDPTNAAASLWLLN